ncbi:MAG: hypothetical protein HY873_13150 [Chloroflexi bacterium]|nr:hypothetical protein [Chloroflexota bacterium]
MGRWRTAREKRIVDHIIGLGRDVFDVLECGHQLICICGEASKLHLSINARVCRECLWPGRVAV